MALTVARTTRILTGTDGTPSIVLAEITGDDAYAVGGEDVTASDFGLTRIDTIIFGSQAGLAPAYTPSTGAGGTLKLFVGGSATTSAAVAVESSVRDLSAVTFWGLVIGRA